ncbi:YidC/Oxa1 family membrane protein insertase [Enterococcus sp. PF1-24]|uniref:membrane protein insertase YidC n=1 Tax=unclassified Enterococcus TaxID=2608891 RepID=UPI0024765C77|nr:MULTISPECIES: membrane protein insertase YidC [unclassified Enterococcus]MDH6365128.1 YidC/Oxa1 family membrane protein insertase [Enterococcus sp. PFB1-1]MDH6402229.1 YidC/Oxa1 family membrane protein insertase [Enterococcus sp. PF1-24]
MTKNKIKKIMLSSGMLSLVLFLSGCVKTNADGTPDESGVIYRFLAKPIGDVITYMVENFNWNYGWAIIFITIIVRIIIMPLGINQSRKSLVQSEKMQSIKPQLDIINKKVKAATTQAEQLAANQEMQALYRDNNLSMTGGIGCLPLLIQMPIFSALYVAVRHTPGISEASFFGINLGNPNIVLTILAGLAYLGQSMISMIGVPEEQKKTMRSMMIMSPLMIAFMSFSSPAGLTLYWVVGGIFGCIQTFITNVLMKPRIKAQIQEELAKNPPKQVVTPIKDVTPTEETPAISPKKRNDGKGRNAGAQQRKK